jgi:hypothetical protein
MPKGSSKCKKRRGLKKMLRKGLRGKAVMKTVIIKRPKRSRIL